MPVVRKLYLTALMLPMATFADVTVFRDGRTLDVALPENAALVLRTAAEDYTNFVARVSGVVPRIRTAVDLKPGENAVRFEPTDALEESWKIFERAGDLVISGGGRRGVLYGVYHFLEDELGVHWLAPGVETVPLRQAFVFSGERSGCPRMRYRDIYFVPGKGATVFLARNRMNTETPSFGGRMRYGSPRDNHTMYACLGKPEEVRELFKEHPDWFPLIDGKRFLDKAAHSGSQSQLCLTNPELRKYWVERLRACIRRDRESAAKRGLAPPMFYAIDQNDCYDGFCKCQSCRAIVDREGGNSGLLLDFANFVAAALEKEAPEATFQMMALHSTEKPPRHLKPRHNVGIRLCDTTSDLLKPWTNPANAKHYGNLVAWGRICDKVAMWDYQITYGAPTCVNYPTPTVGTFAADLRALAENGGDGVFFEHEEPVGADMRDLKVWMEIKLAEDPYQDPAKLLCTFTDGYYGAAAAKIRAYLVLLAKAAKSAGASVSWMPAVSAYSFIDDKTMSRALDLFAAAEAAVGDDAKKLERVRHARLSLDKLRIMRGDRTAVDGYCRTWEVERAYRTSRHGDGYKANVERFLAAAEKYRNLPMPERFADLPRNSVFLFNAGMGVPGVDYHRGVPDESATAGEALRFVYNTVCNRDPKNKDDYRCPFEVRIAPLFGKDEDRFVAEGDFSSVPGGYGWYKLASDVKLAKESKLFVFSDYHLDLEGVVSDNSELGQMYDVWASVRVIGPDCFAAGHAQPGNVFLLDQIAVVLKKSNKEGCEK